MISQNFAQERVQLHMLGFVINLASYVITRGQQIPDGDTVGYSDTQRLRVTYRTSPLEQKEQVAFLALPGGSDV
jgi:hypothetical protein